MIGKARSQDGWLQEPWELPGLVLLTCGQSQVLGWVIVGPGFPDLETAYLVSVASSDIAGCGFQGVPKLALAPCERDWIPRCLVEESKVSLSSCCPVSGWGWDLSCPRARIGLLVGRARAAGVLGWPTGVLAVSCSGPEASIPLLVGRVGVQEFLGLVPTHWYAKVHLVKAMVFPVVMYGCESWTIKKAER